MVKQAEVFRIALSAAFGFLLLAPYGDNVATQPPTQVIGRKIELTSFDSGDAALTTQHTRALEEFLRDIKSMTVGAIILTGHSDSIEQAGNRELPKQRAMAVRNFLLSNDWSIDYRTIHIEDSQPAPAPSSCTGAMEREQFTACLAPYRGVTLEVVGVRLKYIPKPRPKTPG